MAYGMPGGPPHDDKTWTELARVKDEYWEGFVDAAMEVVSEKRAGGWFYGLDDFVLYQEEPGVYSASQMFAMCVCWEIEELTQG